MFRRLGISAIEYLCIPHSLRIGTRKKYQKQLIVQNDLSNKNMEVKQVFKTVLNNLRIEMVCFLFKIHGLFSILKAITYKRIELITI
jgi:hypothetical protein